MSYHQTIYNVLRQNGLTEAGALGLIGNLDCESNCEPYRVQGDFSSFRTVSKAYVNAINLGHQTREGFSRDQKGFGLAQWTYFSRKGELFDEWKRRGGSIDDVTFQVEFALKELKRDFPNDYSLLRSTNDIYAAVKAVCDRFENPAVKNYDARFQAAVRIKHEIDLNSLSTSPSEPINDDIDTGNDYVDWAVIPAPEYWPPRVICKGMHGSDVLVLKSILSARGYNGLSADITGYLDGETDMFDEATEEEVKQFQRGFKLDVDGIVGPLTWGKLLER